MMASTAVPVNKSMVLFLIVVCTFGVVQSYQTHLASTSWRHYSYSTLTASQRRMPSTPRDDVSSRKEDATATRWSAIPTRCVVLQEAVSSDEADNDPSVASSDSSWRQRLRQSVVSVFRKPTAGGLSFRQRLAKMGLATVLSYGWVSNMSYCVSVSAAWYIFSKQTGLSPLAPGQWKGFLAVYAGFWVFNNVVRPLRLAVSVGVAPKFDAIVSTWQTKFQLSRAAAVAITVVLANIVGTIALMSLGIFGASLLAGVPVFPKTL